MKAPIYVDALADRGWRLGKNCHLFCDPGNIQALHAFAQRIGLRREWFQTDSAMPHYDLTERRRLTAKSLGAVALTRNDTVAVIRAWRARSPAPPAERTEGEGN